jgi:RNA polymerase sigma-B factor
VSLDTPINDEGATSLDLLGEVDESMELLEGWASLAPAIRDLPARERRVLYLRFFGGLTQSEIAEEIGVSQMHVSRILSQTLAILRGSMAPEGRSIEEGDDVDEGAPGMP